eukprot:gene17687-24042_t
MCVKFADPPKRSDGPITGITPKKLFVGQVPPTLTEQELRDLFSPYGNITDVHVVKKTQGAGCAFVTFSRWRECENAIEALNARHHLEGAKAPMVVKFADAKIEGGGGGGMMMNGMMGMPGMMGGMMGGPGNKRPYGASDQFGSGSNKKQFAGNNGMMGGYGGMGYGGDMGMQGMQGMPYGGMQGMMGGNMMAQQGMMGGNMMGRSGGQGNGNMLMQNNRMGAGVIDEGSKQWKLFVGQVPFEANEGDLYPLFSEVGNVLELVVLRNPTGRSKGCAFVTFETRVLAEKAIRQIDRKMCLPNDPRQRLLLVKYANPNANAGGDGNAGMVAQSDGTEDASGGMGQMGQMGQMGGQLGGMGQPMGSMGQQMGGMGQQMGGMNQMGSMGQMGAGMGQQMGGMGQGGMGQMGGMGGAGGMGQPTQMGGQGQMGAMGGYSQAQMGGMAGQAGNYGQAGFGGYQGY